MFRFICFIFSFLLASIVFASHQTEVKFLIPDISRLPQSVLEAMKSGDEHPHIIDRGLIVQEYLALTSQNLVELFKRLNDAGIPLGSAAEENDFLQPGATQEIRLLRRYRHEGGSDPSYRISLMGGQVLGREKLQTPESLTPEQHQEMQRIFLERAGEVHHRISKLYFEIRDTDGKGNIQLHQSGEPVIVEVDMFFHIVDGVRVPFMMDGEIRFRTSKIEDAMQQAERYRSNASLHPAYFDQDVSNIERLRSRNLAHGRLPSFISSAMAEHDQGNRFYFSQFLSAVERWMDVEAVCSADAPQAFLNKPYSLSVRVLMNAEPFGFGPTSLISEIFPYLRDRIQTLSYIGTGHTLDLQKRLSYDRVHSYSAADADHGKAEFIKTAEEYDVFITATDFEAADWAREAGLKVIIYDPLTWYWKDIPQTVSLADFYITQNFYGVRRRLDNESYRFPPHVVVPPVVSKLYESDQATDKTLLLVNFGGLANNFMTYDVLIEYVSSIIRAINKTLSPHYDRVVFLGNEKLADSVGTLCKGCQIQTVTPQQVQKLLAESSLAVMTSGLGNIYEAATAGKNVIWLPPANDSQGQQVKALIAHDMVLAAIDWHDVLPDTEVIKYTDPQPVVLKSISQRMSAMTSNKQASERLSELLDKAREIALTDSEIKIKALSDAFSFGGARIIADNILQWLRARY